MHVTLQKKKNQDKIKIKKSRNMTQKKNFFFSKPVLPRILPLSWYIIDSYLNKRRTSANITEATYNRLLQPSYNFRFAGKRRQDLFCNYPSCSRWNKKMLYNITVMCIRGSGPLGIMEFGGNEFPKNIILYPCEKKNCLGRKLI